MPIQNRDSQEAGDNLYATVYRIELSPAEPVDYTLEDTVKLQFNASELYKGGEITQPARFAAMKALVETKHESGLVRVRTLQLGRGGKFSATVEIAVKAP